MLSVRIIEKSLGHLHISKKILMFALDLYLVLDLKEQ